MELVPLYSIIVVLLVIFAGMMSGLTLGLMSLDVMDLRVLEQSGTPTQRLYARKILPVVENPHFTLVTLLLCNAIAVEALPIFLDDLVHEVTAIALSVTVVLVFGEILPQAVCCRYGLIIGAYSARFVLFLRLITFPISYPISKILDWAIGTNHANFLNRPELRALVQLHTTRDNLNALTKDEVDVIIGALDMQAKTVKSAMTPLEKVFMISEDDVLDQKTVQRIVQTGHSRIPVHSVRSRNELIGLFLVKELILIDLSKHIRVGQLTLRSLPHLPASMPMFDVLNLFKTGKSHMAVLMEIPEKTSEFLDETELIYVDNVTKGRPVGIVTIEDLIEELLQDEVVDETDRFVDNLQTEGIDITRMIGRIPPHVRQWIAELRPVLAHRRSRNNDGIASEEGVPLLNRTH